MVRLRRTRAGLYDGEIGNNLISVEYLTTGYGDSGWVWWINEIRSDYPVDTKARAMRALEVELRGRGWVED